MATTHRPRSRESGTGTAGTYRRLMGAFLLAAGLLAGPLATPAAAQDATGQLIAADRAMTLASAGELTVIDVRSPEEWQQTGVPAGAELVTIHQPDGLIGFLDAMTETLGDDRSRPIALICARGNRSSIASSALAQTGYTRVYNIREGMLGSADGPGWLARGLPTDRCSVC